MHPGRENSNGSLADVVRRRVALWNRRIRVGSQTNVDQFLLTKRPETAIVCDVIGQESADEAMENDEEPKPGQCCNRLIDSTRSNCVNANSFPSCNLHLLHELQSSIDVNSPAIERHLDETIVHIQSTDHRVDETIDQSEKKNQRETDESRDLSAQPEQWRNFAPASRACRPTFVFDPAGKLSYYWSMVVSVAFLYNLWVIAYRFSFDEITLVTRLRWFCLDYICDFIYLLDIAVQFRTGFLEDGVLQTSPKRLRIHYTNSTKFYMDLLSLLPLDFLYLSLGYRSILRCFRLTKVYKGYAFVEKTERHTNYPNVIRGLLLLHAILLIFHWNACIVYTIRGYLTFPSNFWDIDDKFYNYLNAFYLSCRTLIMVDTLPRPKDKSKLGLLFITVESIAALVIFASVLGQVASIVANISAARKHFQVQMDGVKRYMHLRKVPHNLQRKVVRWFDYWWSTRKYGNDGAVMECLPDKLKAEIAIHVHLDTLKRVEIFRNTEPGFLCELVLKLRPMLFSPGDYVCRKGNLIIRKLISPGNVRWISGEVGNEMYIVSVGRLQVLADDGRTVLATLKAGSYFGEISVLNMGTEGNRRTASVVSVGYSDLFCLSKRDIWEVLQDYPTARNRLELIAQKRLHQKLAHMEKGKPKTEHHALAPKSSGGSYRRGSAPAIIHLNVAPASSSRGQSPSKTQTPRQSDRYRTRTFSRLAPPTAFSRYSNPVRKPVITFAANSDEASTLCDVEDMDEETIAKSERTQLLSQTKSGQSPDFHGQFSNNGLTVSPDADAPLFADRTSGAEQSAKCP